MLLIPVLGRLRLEDLQFKASHDYMGYMLKEREQGR
jgi:hypothetical protein